ncbi:MAG TPA: hypothetical protein VIM58_10710, partial [Candidatus Methylacidiphilales bacterium]
MKPFRFLLALLLPFLAWSQAGAALVYVIPIDGEIEPSLATLVKRGVREAVRAKADYLVLRLDTPGGRADAMEEIVRAVESFPNQENTVAYVDKKAASAGAFIASSTRRIYMAPGSVIGAATPVMLGAGGGAPEKLPESYERKIVSFFDATGRATAERHGHDPEVFAAMVDSERGLVVDGVTILPKGRILTLTNGEAEKAYGKPPKPLLSSGTVPTLDALARQLAGADPEGARIETLKPTGFETLARFLVKVGPLLLTCALILGWLEFKAPGTWFFGAGAAVCFLLFFLGSYVAGLSGYEPLALFVLGLLLVALEIFFLPGLVVPVATGLLLLVIALLWALAGQTAEPGRALPALHDLAGAFLRLALAVVVAIVACAALARTLVRSGVATRSLERATGHGA